jgi:small subunit ribosomal protein S20
MANIKSAKKRILVIETKTNRNRRVKSHLKAILKNFEAAIASGDKETAREKLALAEKRLMQAASKGTIHKNAASRKVGRITTRFTNTFGVDALAERPNAAEKPTKAPKKADKKAKSAAAEEAAVAQVEAAEAEVPAESKSTKKESLEEAEAATEETSEAGAKA